MILIGKKLSPTVSFILYDEETEKITEAGNTEMTNLILNKTVSNAQLENTVIKMTDGNLKVIDPKNAHNVFYVLGCTDGIYSLIDGTGEIWKMSLNAAKVFLEQGKRKLTNAKLCSDKIVINKHRNYSTALRRSTEHYHQS
ncbi:MAG: hypothetical protein MSJ26_11920 [Oscillospiraceae bacterium]|nr:hypothetical protein [Oscillospiraceae bacterium]